MASGQLAVTEDGGFVGSFAADWLSSLAIFTGFYSIGMCAYLAAVYLAREADLVGDEELKRLWRQRALSTGLWMGVLSFAGLAIVWVEAPDLASGFVSRGWPLVILSILAGIGSLVEVWRQDYRRAVFAAGGAVAAAATAAVKCSR